MHTVQGSCRGVGMANQVSRSVGVAAAAVSHIWEKLLNPFKQVDKRQLQHEIDTYYRLGASGGEEVAREIQALADSTAFTTQQAERKECGNTLSRTEVSEKFYEFGYTLVITKSDIDHKEAGEGLFLRGAVVCLYPGVIYAPSQYRYMPGYPRVDKGNPYLIARYEGLVLDGKSWGRGGDQREWWEGGNSHELDPPELSADKLRDLSSVGDGGQRMWESVTGVQNLDVPIEGAILERRNPLAFGHFANHPPKDRKPNVMVCSYSAPVGDEIVRPYVPNVMVGLEEQEMQRRELLWIKEGRSADDGRDEKAKREIRSLVLVATRGLENEELLLTYRLSSYRRRPLWYHAVDEEEDSRRWE